MSSPYSRGPVWVEVGPTTYRVDYRPAGDWLNIIGRSEIDTLILGSVSTDRLYERTLDGSVPMDQLRSASTSLIGVLTGYGARWWVGYNLVALSYGRSAMGSMALKGVDPFAVSLEVWCAAIHTLFTANGKTEDVVKFDAQMDVPPPGYDVGDAWDDGYDPRVAAQGMPGMG